MRWFKHKTDFHRDEMFQNLLDDLGYFGPFFVTTLIEMCAEKLEPQSGKRIQKEDCEFVFHERVLCSVMRAKPSTVRRALDAGASCGFFTWSSNERQIKICMPKLAESLTSDQKKPEKNLRRNEIKSRLEEDLDKDLEKEYSPKPSQRENSVTKKQIQKTENGSEAAEKKDFEKSPGTTLRQVADVPNPTLAFEARFKNHQDPRRQEFVETIAIMTNAIPQIAGLFNRTRFINEAMDVFSRTSDFDLFADQLIQSVKTQKPKDVRAYASAVWREQITKNRHSPEIELPSLEGIDGV